MKSRKVRGPGHVARMGDKGTHIGFWVGNRRKETIWKT